jgi:ATP-dependent DNA ligase
VRLGQPFVLAEAIRSARWTAMPVPGAKIPLPLAFIPPGLPIPSQKAPSGSAWVHEIKHDGYRLIARRDGLAERDLTAEMQLRLAPLRQSRDRFSQYAY